LFIFSLRISPTKSFVFFPVSGYYLFYPAEGIGTGFTGAVLADPAAFLCLSVIPLFWSDAPGKAY